MNPKIEGLKKYTVLLNSTALFEAQARAVKNGMNPKIVGNNSAFLRQLIADYCDNDGKENKNG